MSTFSPAAVPCDLALPSVALAPASAIARRALVNLRRREDAMLNEANEKAWSTAAAERVDD